MLSNFFNYLHSEPETDIEKLGPINENKLEQLKSYIIKDDFKNFSEFVSFYSMNSMNSHCAVSWATNSLAVRCKQCMSSSNCCVCVKCFLEGPHKHHDFVIHMSNTGNCDCGDISAWKPEGFCKRHRKLQTGSEIHTEDNNNASVDDNDNYFVPDYKIKEQINSDTEENRAVLTPKLKEKLLKTFKIIRDDIENMIEKSNFHYFNECCKFFSCFSKLGDEIRSCVSESLNDVDFLRKIVLNAQYLDNNNVKEFFCLAGSLFNDYQFSIPFSEAVMQTIPELLDCIRRSSAFAFINPQEKPICGISMVLRYDFMYYCKYSIETLILQNKMDWIGLLLKCNDVIADFILNEYDINCLVNFEPVLHYSYSYNYMIRKIFQMDSEKPKMKRFFIEFCKSIEKFEGFLPTFANRSQMFDVFEYILNVSTLPHKFLKRFPYFVPEVFDIFIHHLFRDPKNPLSTEQAKGYSQAILLHQLILKHMLIFNRKNPISDYDSKVSPIAGNSNDNNKEESDEIEFNVCYDGKDPQDTFDYYCKLNLLRKGRINQSQIDQKDPCIQELITNIYLKAIDQPMSLIVTHYLLNFGIKEFKLPRYCNECVERIHKHRSFQTRILPDLISFVQVFFSFADKDQKDVIFKFIVKKFGAIRHNSNDHLNQTRLRDFAFIFFISSLILDRDGINDDVKELCLKNLMTEMKYRNVSLTQIPSLIEPSQMVDPAFKHKYETMNIENDWNIVVPYYFQVDQFHSIVLPSIIEKTEEMILPFPEFIQPDDLHNDKNYCSDLLLKKLPEVFESKFLFAAIYYFIYEYSSDIIMIQYALNLFITLAENSTTEDESQEHKTIQAHNFDEFVSNIKTNNFKSFAKTDVNYKGNQAISLVKLVNDLGVIGLSALRRAGLSIEPVKKSKAKILKLKNRIKRVLRNNSSRFEDTIDQRNHDCCSLCHKIIANSNLSSNEITEKFENEMLFIPVSIFESASTDLIENFIHDTIKKKFISKNYIRQCTRFKYVHIKCFQKARRNGIFSNGGRYILMPKIDRLPFEMPSFENSGEINNQLKDSEERNSIQISLNSDSRSRNTPFNININLNMNNININGIPLQLQINNNTENLLNSLFGNHNDAHLQSQRSIAAASSTDQYGVKGMVLKSIRHFLIEADFHHKALEILSQMIIVLDYRSRLSPEILDDQSLLSFYSNLFQISTYVFYFNETEYDLSSFIKSKLDDFIYKCLKLKISKTEKEKQDEYMEFIKNNPEFSKISLNQYLFAEIIRNKFPLDNEGKIKIDEQFHEFLRRCYLIEKFYLCDKSDIDDSFIDWDSYLDIHYLYHHFYFKDLPDVESFDLPVYRGVNFPNNFLELVYPPFNVNFESLDQFCSIDVFSGHIHKRLPHLDIPFSACLNLSGKCITGMHLSTKYSFMDSTMPSIYVDTNGFEDPGYVRGNILLLSQEKYNKLIDDFLTGNILNYSNQ